MGETIFYLMQREMLRRGYSPRTIQTYSFCIKQFFKKYNKEPKEVTKKNVKDYLDELAEKNKAGSTINLNLNAIKFLFEEIMHRNIFIKLKYSKRPKTLPTVLTKEEVKRLFDAIENKKHKLMVQLMYSAGLRVSELINLRIRDLELDKSYGWVRKGKGSKDRLFIIAERLNKELRDFIRENNLGYDSYLFNGRKGSVHPRTVQEIIKKGAKKAKIEKNVHCHTLRHSFATHLIENGYDVNSLQSLLGHNSSDTTRMYIHMAGPKLINVKSPLDEL